MICKGFFVKKTAQPKDADFENQIPADIENQIFNMVNNYYRAKAFEQFQNLMDVSGRLALIRCEYAFLKEFSDSDKKEEALQALRNEYKEKMEIFSNPTEHITLKAFMLDVEKLALFEIFTTPIPNLD